MAVREFSGIKNNGDMRRFFLPDDFKDRIGESENCGCIGAFGIDAGIIGEREIGTIDEGKSIKQKQLFMFRHTSDVLDGEGVEHEYTKRVGMTSWCYQEPLKTNIRAGFTHFARFW
jgi:hypothetical protein